MKPNTKRGSESLSKSPTRKEGNDSSLSKTSIPKKAAPKAPDGGGSPSKLSGQNLKSRSKLKKDR